MSSLRHAPKYALGFSLRADATMELPKMQALVERALGCKLVPGQWNKLDFLLCEILGMKILFGQWRGIGGRPIFQLHGITEVPADLAPTEPPPEVTIIDAVVIDLLDRVGAGIWHEPSLEEIRAEGEYAERLEREYYAPRPPDSDSSDGD
jgi:hypothetical protein